MSAVMIVGLVVLLLLAVSVGWSLHARKAGKQVKSDLAVLPAASEVSQEVALAEPEPVLEVLFGEDPCKPAVTIRALSDDAQFAQAAPVSETSGVVAMVDSLLQAAPPIGLAGAHHGRKLMEVSIAGEMMKAADSDGLRAMARGSDGKIVEHGRLYGTQGLKKAVSAAAVWQVASIVVAQKHMADITEKLQEISEGVRRTNEFLEAQRLSKITGTYDYLREIAQSIQDGELPDSGWKMLEPKEADLREIRNHLNSEFESSLRRATDPDTFGTEGLSKNIQKKYEQLQHLVATMELCLKTRLLVCFVRSLYPREQAFTRSRLGNLLEEVQQLQRLKSVVSEDWKAEVGRIDSKWNSASTLADRRKMVEQTAIALENSIEASMSKIVLWGSSLQKKTLQGDESRRMLVEVVDGEVRKVMLA